MNIGKRLICGILLLFALASALSAKERILNGDAPGKLTDWSLVYHHTYIHTTANDTYNISSLGLNISFRNRWRLPLVSSTTIFLPQGIVYNDEGYGNLGTYYESMRGIEQTLAVEFGGNWGAWRWRLAPGWTFNGISMPGRVGYYPFQSFTSGPALLAGLDKDWEQGVNVHITAFVSYQFIDFIHSSNKLDRGITAHLGIGLGFKDGAAAGRYKDEK